MKAIVILGFVLLTAQTALDAQDSLGAAKDLYASAAFEDALSTLTRLSGGGSITPDIARQVDEYRAFCLFALGRTGEAESIAEAIIRKDPLKTLDGADASPRVETMFSSVRKRLLPSLIRDRFRTARTAVDQKNLPIAETQLVEARLLIAEAEKLGVKDDGLSDLSVLVEGFLQLVRSNAEQRTLPQPAAAIPSVGAAVAVSQNVDPGPAPRTTGAPRVYSVDDAGVTPPVIVNQRIPAMDANLLRVTKATKTSGVIEVVIDEKGDVTDAIIRVPLNATFDNLLLEAARGWKYRPAVKDGVAVRYLKTIALIL